MGERIDQGFIDKIVAAKKAGTLKITNESDQGASLKFPYLASSIEMHLGPSNWAIVKEALAGVTSGKEN